jgi:hypothetical protein
LQYWSRLLAKSVLQNIGAHLLSHVVEPFPCRFHHLTKRVHTWRMTAASTTHNARTSAKTARSFVTDVRRSKFSTRSMRFMNENHYMLNTRFLCNCKSTTITSSSLQLQAHNNPKCAITSLQQPQVCNYKSATTTPNLQLQVCNNNNPKSTR